jgi:hypothetical protein
MRPQSTVPNDLDLRAIPLARAGEYELSEREVKKTRSRVYSLNRDNAGGWRWRTLREGTLLLIWRIK